MCGRFLQITPVRQLALLFDLMEAPDFAPRYNIAPSQAVAAVRLAEAKPGRELVLLRWGLVPPWADDPRIGNQLINARSETVAGKPAFRAAFQQRRCLIPADGFYEWQKLGKYKQPYCVRRRDGQPLVFAGLWEHWQRGDRPFLESCTILTTEANDLVKPIHNRMPVILAPADCERWLDPRTPKAKTEQLLRPCPAAELIAFPVSHWVNDPKHEGPQCLQSA